jgi:poly [ADP-ribose] polymerase
LHTDLQAIKRATCRIVSLDWLLDSMDAMKALPEKSYLLPPGGPSTKDDNQSDSATERIEDKKRPANGAAEVEPTNKKLKSAQIASSKSLKIPADPAFVHQSPNFLSMSSPLVNAA